LRRDANLKHSSLRGAPHNAQFERALIVERTKAGLAAARAQGRVGGNPALRSRDPAVLRKIVTSRAQTRLAALLPGADGWLIVVRRLRPGPGLGTRSPSR
jgi:hypothetical protein